MDTGSVTRPDNPLPSQQPTDPQATLRNQEGERAQSPASWEHQVSRAPPSRNKRQSNRSFREEMQPGIKKPKENPQDQSK
ncbi:hypothetical protein JEQ12_016795 [Ovis aries]|uniref:Uncharacterized protein n=1 Tax=Ovis aries TaxID=9940 RepID=A0A836D5P9_SHEEP|nr:hypothetical protein JEQ12_016795 [Ovis aries]